MSRSTGALSGSVVVAAAALALLMGCRGGGEVGAGFEPESPGQGPGQMVGQGVPVTAGAWSGTGDLEVPAAREVDALPTGFAPDCGGDCLSYCEGLDLQNPVNRGLCPSLWGVGLETRPVAGEEACRRIFADTMGRFPTLEEVESVCRGRPWVEVARELVSTPEFVRLNQRRWADRLLYDSESVSVIRIADADDLVGKLYRGQVPYDQFAAVISAHPVLTRRHATSGDRAEALFWLFLGRPPLGSERSDMGKLYNLWDNGYYDHPQLGMRLPDAHIRFRCIDEESGQIDEGTRGECTSILYGYHELILEPDIRVRGDDGTMWSGLLTSEEWSRLQIPGRLLAEQPLFWEKAVDDVLEQYLGYDLGRMVPEVRHELVSHLLAHEGDIRAVHHAVLSSSVYLQSTTGESQTDYRWTFGPLKQAEPELWIDTITRGTGVTIGSCDHRVPRPGRILDSDTIAARALVENSGWTLDEEGEVEDTYRDLARSLGGCPANDDGTRFKIVSVLTTATQLSFVDGICDPGFAHADTAAPIATLLPGGVAPDRAVDAELAREIWSWQTARFFGRRATAEELAEAAEAGRACARTNCRAEEFARPACFALLSSAEMLFY